jgi:hypothetical protein
MGIESFVWESIQVNMAMSPWIYSKKYTSMKESTCYKKALKLQAKEINKWLSIETHTL